MTEIPVSKKFDVLCQIVRAQHFAWRAAVVETCPDVDPAETVKLMWQLTGDTTAQAYLGRIDLQKPVARQVAESIAWSSRCMGEDAVVEAAAGDGPTDEAFVRHDGCPWKGWHERQGLLAEDRPGCDAWFAATVDGINRSLDTNLRFETLESLPEGGASCRRRFWVEPDSTKSEQGESATREPLSGGANGSDGSNADAPDSQ